MERVKGLREYVQSEKYRNGLQICDDIEMDYEMLAQGEYNINYLFTHPATGQKLVLRVNTGSQMCLTDQIGYEYRALKLLEESGRTPRPLYVDGSKEQLDYGVLVMEYLSGRQLVYEKDMLAAARCLADIHSLSVPEEHKLMISVDPLAEILAECRQMIRVYCDSALGDPAKKKQIGRMLQKGEERIGGLKEYQGYRCCINTELNSTNFLINGSTGQDYLIDWEKPLWGDPAQDLGHFLAPTTTFWKTDVILTPEEIGTFIRQYEECVNGRFDISRLKERVDRYIPLTCLRGITWCAMAWIEYHDPQRMIKNESTFRKLTEYLDQSFLDKIEQEYL